MDNIKISTNDNSNELLMEIDKTGIKTEENKNCLIASNYTDDNKFIINKLVSEFSENSLLFKTNDELEIKNDEPFIIPSLISDNLTTEESIETISKTEKNCFFTPFIPSTLDPSYVTAVTILNAWLSMTAINACVSTKFNEPKFNNNNNHELKLKNDLTYNCDNEKNLQTNNNTENINKNQNLNFSTNDNLSTSSTLFPIFNKNDFVNFFINKKISNLTAPLPISLIMALLQYNKQNQQQSLLKQQIKPPKKKQNYNNSLSTSATMLIKSHSVFKKKKNCSSQLNTNLNKAPKKQFNIKTLLNKCDLNQSKQQQLFKANLSVFKQKLNETLQKSTKFNETKLNNNFCNVDYNKSFKDKKINEINDQQKFKIFSIKERQNDKEILLSSNNESQASTSTNINAKNSTQQFNAVIYDAENELKKGDKINVNIFFIN